MTVTRNKVKERPEAVSGSSTNGTAAADTQNVLTRLIQPGRTRTLLTCFALCIVALGFNLYRIGTPSIWFDEALSVNRAQQSLSVLFKIVSTTQPNMALYYFLLHFWLDLTGLVGLHATETIVRLPSAIFAAADALVLYFLARRFFGQIVAILATLLYLLNTLQLTYAQETRSYTLQLLFIGLSWYALFVLFSTDLARKRARNWWICFVAASTLAMYSQLFTELVLVTQFAAIAILFIIPNVWRSRIRQQVRPLLISWVSIAVLSAPIVYASRVGSKTGWLPIPQPSSVYHLFLTIGSESKIMLGLFALSMLLGVCVGLLATLPQGKNLLKKCSLWPATDDKQWQKRFLQLLPLAVFLVCWMLFPVIISYVVSQKSTRLFSPRYLVVIVPAFILLAALGLSVIRWRIVQVVLGICLVLLCLRYVPDYYNSAQVEDWRTGTQWLQQQYQKGDGLICYDNSEGCAVDMEYYLQAYPQGDAHFDSDSPGYFPWVNYDTTNQLGDYQQALNTDAIQAYGTEHPRLFYALGRADPTTPQVKVVLQWLNQNYKLLNQVSTSTLTIYLYDTTAYQPHLA